MSLKKNWQNFLFGAPAISMRRWRVVVEKGRHPQAKKNFSAFYKKRFSKLLTVKNCDKMLFQNILIILLKMTTFKLSALS